MRDAVPTYVLLLLLIMENVLNTFFPEQSHCFGTMSNNETPYCSAQKIITWYTGNPPPPPRLYLFIDCLFFSFMKEVGITKSIYGVHGNWFYIQPQCSLQLFNSIQTTCIYGCIQRYIYMFVYIDKIVNMTQSSDFTYLFG